VIRRLRHALSALTGIALTLGVTGAAGLHWERLPDLPDRLGVAGAFAGVDHGVLLVAGGANFPGSMPWDGGTKVWHRTVYALAQPDGAWTRVGDLPEPLAYGVALTHPRGLLCLGGSSAGRHHATARILRWHHHRLQLDRLPDLPAPRANAAGALVGGKAFVFGGTSEPGSVTAETSLFILDPEDDPPVWREGPSLPASGRMLATAGVMADTFFVFGGAALHPGPDGLPPKAGLEAAGGSAPGGRCGADTRTGGGPTPVGAGR
jgi:N-acetylneuraminic acid mutarotase